MIWFLLALASVVLWVLLAIGLMVDGGGVSRRRPAVPGFRPPAEQHVTETSQSGGAEKVSSVHHLIDRTLACIRDIESDHRYSAVSADSRYFGAYQFDSRTWGSVGGRGDPSAAAPSEQDYRAALLLLRRGLKPWPSADGCAA